MNIYGLLDPTDKERPLLEDDHQQALCHMEGGWLLDCQFESWSEALEWFNAKMRIHRALQENDRKKRSPEIPPDPRTGRISPQIAQAPPPLCPQARSRNQPLILEGPDPAPSPTAGYIGMERKEPFKRICIQETIEGFQEIQTRLNENFLWVLRLPSYDEAYEWVHQAPLLSPGSAAIPALAVASQRGNSVTFTNASAPPMFMVSSDPSAGDDSKIFGINVIDQDLLDKALGPNGLPSGKDFVSLYDKCMDVAALPGASVLAEEGSEDNENMHDVMEIMAMAISQATAADKTGRSMLFKSRTNNPLLQIKSEADILDLQDKVRKASEDDLKSQTKQLRSFLHKRGYKPEYIANYVDSGGLPRLIRRMLEHYKALIKSVILALRNFSEGS